MHSICLIGRSAAQGYPFLYKRINEYLSSNYAVVYAVEEDIKRVLHRLRERNSDTNSFIRKKALTIVRPTSLFSFKIRNGFDPRQILNVWNGMIRIARQSKTRGVLLMGAPNLVIEGGWSDQLIVFEGMIGKDFAESIETICCYDTSTMGKLPFSKLISLLGAHNCSIHLGWRYQKWCQEMVGSAIRRQVDTLLGNGTADLLFRTFQLVYKMSNVEHNIMCQPETFEIKLKRLAGIMIADKILQAASEDIIAFLQFNRSNNNLLKYE